MHVNKPPGHQLESTKKKSAKCPAGEISKVSTRNKWSQIILRLAGKLASPPPYPAVPALSPPGRVALLTTLHKIAFHCGQPYIILGMHTISGFGLPFAKELIWRSRS